MAKSSVRYSDIFTPEAVAYYMTHPAHFVYDLVFHKDGKPNGGELYVSPQQEDLFLSVLENKKTTVKSARGVGKTTSVSLLAPWWMCMYPHNTKVIYTAPSYNTLQTALWPEVALWLNRSIVKDLFEYTKEELYLKGKRQECFAKPKTAKDKESFSGIHAENLLIICDEASGISDEILNTLDATLTSGKNNKIVFISNPTRVSGFYYNTHKSPAYDKAWKRLTFSAIDSPFVDREVIEVKKEQYGENHPLYKVDILGEFPEGNTDAFISLADVEESMYRDAEPVGEIEVGVDVARYGDDSTVVYWRHGNKVYPAITATKQSITETARMVLRTIQEIRDKTDFQRCIKVKVDDTGVGGGCVDLLKEDRDNNIEVIPINFGGAGNEVYHNEVSIMWGNLKDRIKSISLPNDNKLREELSARRWSITPNGKIKIEPKDTFKRDFGASPDRADALVLCFANKSNEKTVIKSFDPLDKSVVKDKLNYSGEEKYAAIFTAKDNSTSIVYTAWDNNRLYIYDEHITDEPAMFVSYNLSLHKPLAKVIGNDRMFNDMKNDLASKYRKLGIYVKENYKYDESSAIDTLTNMFTQKKIIISVRCRKTIEQIRDWKMDVSRMDQERSFGICYALLHIVADLKKKIQRDPSLETPQYIPYQQEETSNGKYNWMV